MKKETMFYVTFQFFRRRLYVVLIEQLFPSVGGVGLCSRPIPSVPRESTMVYGRIMDYTEVTVYGHFILFSINRWSFYYIVLVRIRWYTWKLCALVR